MSGPTPSRALNRGYEAWNSGDVDRFLEVLHPEVVWEPSGAFPGTATHYERREGVREFLSEFLGAWESVRIQFEEVRELAPDVLLIRMRFRARGRDGIEVEQDFGQRYEIRDELIYRMYSYGTWEEALSATGAGTA